MRILLQSPRQIQQGRVVQLQEKLKTKPETYWVKRGEQMALGLFHDMAKRVPAYADFLAKNHFDPKRVRDIQDFAEIPLMDKNNYLRKYPREALCWDGRFADRQWVISTTSGSTGEPFYFPRTNLQDEYYAITAELYLRENFEIQHKKTLYIDAFAMGAWIGGVFTYEAIKRVAAKGYQLSIITPGINKDEVINNVRKLGDDFDQVIIGCYPPIMKDIIDLGIERGLKWGKYNLGIVFSAEGFSEEFRDYIIKYGKLANPYTSTLNHYGTVDLGTMSHETPASILVRRQALEDERLFSGIFGDIYRQPTFTQFMPEMFYFEERAGDLICSSRSGLPLLRYDLKDRGGVVTLDKIKSIYNQAGRDLREELKEHNLERTLWNLPFVYLYERSDFSVTFLGSQIYPEEIRRPLLDKRLERAVTGRFTMISDYDRHSRSFLELNVELKHGAEPSHELAREIRDLVIANLLEHNSEYRSSYNSNKTAALPKIKLWAKDHPLYFHGIGKQKWVKK